MRRVGQLIDERLVARARLLEGLTGSLRQLLPPALAPHCRVCGLTPEHLAVVADGSGWATQLRYLQREIIKHINAHHGLGLKRIRVQVTARPLSEEPASAGSGRKKRERPVVPPTAGDVLRDTARSTEDRRLALALERLAARAGQVTRKR